MTTTGSKSKYKRVSAKTVETDDDTPTKSRVFDFSNGGFSIIMTIPQIFTVCGLVITVTWFLATQWFLDTRMEKLKTEFNQQLTSNKETITKDNQGVLNILEDRVEEKQRDLINGAIQELKLKNQFLK